MIAPSTYLLDTNTATFILNGSSHAARRHLAAAANSSRIAVSTVTQAELLFGVARKPGATKLALAVNLFLGSVEILPWDTPAAVAYARLRAAMNAVGKNLSELDMCIAAHALSIGATLVTHDRAFQHAAPLVELTDWATDL